jgi:hypothetical protein
LRSNASSWIKFAPPLVRNRFVQKDKKGKINLFLGIISFEIMLILKHD